MNMAEPSLKPEYRLENDAKNFPSNIYGPEI